MKIYYLDGEKMSIDSLRNVAILVEGLEALYLSDDDVVKILRNHGMNITIDNICGSLYSSLQWLRP